MAEGFKFTQSLKKPSQWIGVALILFFLAVVMLGAMRDSSRRVIRAPVPLQNAHVIGIAMFQYANDHNGLYPSGTSSTQVFQKLIDGGYVTDPARFYQALLEVPGKTKATSKVLKPENVCWDVTIPLDAGSSDLLPVVFSTGYRINFISGGSAIPLFAPSQERAGIAVCYLGNNAAWLKNDGQPDGIVTNFVSDGKKYQQLTPDGPWP